MGIGPVEASNLTLSDYQAVLFHWERAHSAEEELEAPDPEFVKTRQAKLAAEGVRILH